MKYFQNNPLKITICDSLLITIILGVAYSLFLGSFALIAPDEGRYAEIAREMVAQHQWITPHLNYILYFEKPILFYWLVGFAIKLFGLSEWVIRLWPAIFGVVGCVITYLAAQKLYNRATGFFAAFILATSLLYFGMAHYANLDMALTVTLAGCFYSFLIGIQAEPGWKRRRFMWLAAVCAALAVLTKGLIGLVFPIMVIGLYVLLLNQWRELKNWHLPSSIFIFLLIALPWHIAIQIKHPSFAYFYLISQQLVRYTTLAASRYEPFYFYSLVFLAGFFPWSAFIIQALRRFWPKWKNRHAHHAEIFILIWLFSILLFFSFSQSQLIPYILPTFPPAAIILGRYFANAQNNPSPGLTIGFAIVPLIAIVFVAFCLAFPNVYPLAKPFEAKFFLLALSFWFIIVTFFSHAFNKHKHINIAIATLITGFLIFLIGALPLISFIDHRSTKPLATKINQLIKPGDEVVAYNHYFQDLPFYTQRRVIVVNWLNELSFGVKHQKNAIQWMIDRTTFWKLFNSKKRLFIVVHRWNYPQMVKSQPHTKFYTLDKTQRNLLISNQGET